MFGCAEVLIAAKSLTGKGGISVHRPNAAFTYHRLLFERHEIIFANDRRVEKPPCER